MRGVNILFITMIALLVLFSAPIPQGFAAEKSQTPWGTASVLNQEYLPQKVVYDLFTGEHQEVQVLLDRVSYLNTIYGSDPFDSSIIVIIHGEAIPYFATKNFGQFRELMARAQSLTVGTPVEFRMCRAAAKLLNFEPQDIHGFVKMIPMADAEIVRLQQAGYAYMQ